MATKIITLEIETQNGPRSVDLQLTRMAIVRAERHGIIDMQATEKHPIAFVYDLAFIAVLGTLPYVKQSQVDAALERWFDEGNLFETLSSSLMEQYTGVFNIADATGTE
jgi:hypothetical protein